VGEELLRQGRFIGVDIEDWYSENHSAGRTSRAAEYLRALEGSILKHALHATTMSQVMAGALAKTYGVSLPEVIYNADPGPSAVTIAPVDGPLKLLWFSQTLGPGRGLEDLFAALPQLQGRWTLELRAQTSPFSKNWIENLIPSALRDRVSIKSPVPPHQLMDVISTHELGLALDLPVTAHKDLTISNKMMQYLQSGLEVVAADTSGVREIRSALPGAVHTYPAGQIESLVTLLNSLIKNRAPLIASRKMIHRSANSLFSYEQQTPRLLASVERALKRRVPKQAV
jgi:glycosyltransferase involved in cell wall biosynthesis